MSFPWDGVESGNSDVLRQAVSVVAGLIVAMITALILVPVVQPRVYARIAGVVGKALTASLGVAAITICAVWIVSFLAGIKSDGQLRAAAVFISAWFVPLLIFSNTRSWVVAAIWVVLCIELWWLVVLFSNMTPIKLVAVAQGPADSSFESLRNKTISEDALLASFLAQAGLCLVLVGRSSLAYFLLLLAAVALIKRGWRMLRESPFPQMFPVRPSTFRALALVPTLLVIVVSLPRGLRRGTGGDEVKGDAEHPHKSNRAEQMGVANRDASAPLDRVFPGVVLYPVVKSSVQLVAPPSQPSLGTGGPSRKPFRIPFDGVYWFWRAPEAHPPESAVVKQGSPAKLIFRSTDGTQLSMEAHQSLGSDIALECCSAVEVEIENADEHPESIGLELTLNNRKLAGRPSQSLGTSPLSDLAQQTLVFKIPARLAIQSFDEMTVRFQMNWWRGDKSANIAIRGFVLVPKS